MSINVTDFRKYVVMPALATLEQYAAIPVTKTAADLLMATAAIESGLGLELVQEAGGPALGVFMIEPPSLHDLLNLLKPSHKAALAILSTQESPDVQVITNLKYAAAICRLFYWRDPNVLPPDTVSGLWAYYKRIWNTNLGAATFQSFQGAIKVAGLTGLPM